MFQPNERLLCLHAADGKEETIFSLNEVDYDPPVGEIDEINGHRYRVIRRAEVEPFAVGHSFWTVHAVEIAHVYH